MIIPRIFTILLALMCPLYALAQEDYASASLYDKLHEPDPNQSAMLIMDEQYSIQNVDGGNKITFSISFNDKESGSEGIVRYSMNIPAGVKRVKMSLNHAVVYYNFHNYIMLDYPSDRWLEDSNNDDNPFKYKIAQVSDLKHFYPYYEPTRIRYGRSEFILEGAEDGMMVYISVRKRDIGRYLEPFVGRKAARNFERSEKDDKWWK